VLEISLQSFNIRMDIKPFIPLERPATAVTAGHEGENGTVEAFIRALAQERATPR
jgi:hypothetical protein